MDSRYYEFMRSFIREAKASRTRRLYSKLEAVRDRWAGPARDACAELLQQDAKAAYNAAHDRAHLHTAIATAVGDRRADWAKYIKNIYMVVGADAARRGTKQFKPGGLLDDNSLDEFGDEWGSWAKDYVDSVGNDKADYLVQSHTDRLAKVAQAADDRGEDPVKALRDPNLTMLLAVSLTEVACASNFGLRVGMLHDVTANYSLMGRVEKEWHCVPDGKARDSHADMEGVRIPFDEPYDVNGDRMLFPGDSSMGADPRNFINCRCWESYYVNDTALF